VLYMCSCISVLQNFIMCMIRLSLKCDSVRHISVELRKSNMINEGVVFCNTSHFKSKRTEQDCAVAESYIRSEYRVIQWEVSVFWKVIISVIVSKKVHVNMGLIVNGYRDTCV
jgi:hypothetical protein